jgi:CBS domain-containing protein
MIPDVAPVDAYTSLQKAIETLRSKGLPILIVCQDYEPVLALTEYDVVLKASGYEDRFGSTTLHEIMEQRPAIRCREDAILADAIRAMMDHRARHVPVVDEKGDLVGALSLVNALGAVTPDAAATWLAKMRQLPAQSFESE